MRYLIIVLLLNLSCSNTNTKDWSFLKLIQAQLVVGKNCPVKIQSQSTSKTPQICYALIGNLDLYKWGKENILADKEIRYLKKTYAVNGKMETIPTSIIDYYFEFISEKTFESEKNHENFFNKFEITEYTILSNPIWLKNNKIILFINRYNKNEFASHGEVLIFEKTGLKWKLILKQQTWIS